MRFLLLANFLFEISIGAILIYQPSLIHPSQDLVALYLSRTFGFLLCILAIWSILLLRYAENKELLSVGYLMFMLIHAGFAGIQYFYLGNGMASFQVVVIHGVFALGFLYYFSKN